MIDPGTIPGAAELVGRGVYRGLPDDIPRPVRTRMAVVVGGAAACVAVARRLVAAGWSVTVVTRDTCCCRVGRGCRCSRGTEVVCVAGGDYLEAVVLRRIDTGRIDASNASALFFV